MVVKSLRYHVRWMIRRDLPEVVTISRLGHQWKRSVANIEHELKHRNMIGVIAEQGDIVVGFVMYELHKTKLEIVDLVVHPEFRRCGVGTSLVYHLVKKLHVGQKERITISVPESLDGAHLFFRSQRFLATSVCRGFFDDEDAYEMEYGILSRMES